MTPDDFHTEVIAALLDAERARLRNERSADGWSTQGFGMARLYLGGRDVRLNLWHSALAVDGLTPDTGMIHTHPWDFTSRIVCGELRNQRYMLSAGTPFAKASATHFQAEITPGPGGDFTNAEGRAIAPSGYPDRRPVMLSPGTPEVYGPGGTYSQHFAEIHHTSYADGTATLNRRDRGGRADRAFTFWRIGDEWVSAEPRTGDDLRERFLLAIDATIERLAEVAPCPG